ncbi:calvin cycle protein CP12-3, chloroplastic [Nymphaea colorata]|uniref:CP12 domain-containing protein n=1 Tax=Nymphaea colorata TaxID=210225 RepID=A0A5K0VIQ3_9MAGN|nr:calvin cycle protein CP12-3, chloroplastic [Nymphaea colorata]
MASVIFTVASSPVLLRRQFVAGKPLAAVNSPRPCAFPRRGALVAKAVTKYKGTQMREQRLTDMIEKKVMEATEVCEGNAESDECKVAWDEVEEVSQAKADLRTKMEKEDPLESYCKENPETDECRIYED